LLGTCVPPLTGVSSIGVPSQFLHFLLLIFRLQQSIPSYHPFHRLFSPSSLVLLMLPMLRAKSPAALSLVMHFVLPVALLPTSLSSNLLSLLPAPKPSFTPLSLLASWQNTSVPF
jgi:hypothetical protein